MRLLAWALLVLQEPDATRLAEALRSDRVEEREEATRKLRQLGRAAAPALEALSKDRDSEVALRARQLLRLIEIAVSLPPAVAVALPGVEDRLAGGDPAAWTEVFLEAVGRDGLDRKDLLFLLGPAARGAASRGAREKICGALNHRPLYGGSSDLIPFLSDPEPAVRCRVLETLRVLGAREAAPAILPLLRDPEAVVRSTAAATCAQLDAGAGEIPPLLGDPDEGVRLSAVEALHRLGYRAALGAVADRLGDPDALVIAAACSAVAALGGREHAAALLKALTHERELVRMRAARALGGLHLKEAIPALASRLEDPSDGVRRSAALALGELEARDRVRFLVPLLKDSFEHVREAAAFALCDLGAAEAAPELLQLAREERQQQVYRLQGPLLKLRAAPSLAVGLLDEEPDWVRETGLLLLVSWGADGCMPRLQSFARGADGRPLAFKAIATVAEGRAWVLELLDSDSALRLEAMATVAEAGWMEAVPRLRRILADGTPAERCSAIDALAGIRAREAIPDLLRCLRDSPGELRGAAVAALSELGAREAIGPIRSLLKSDDDRERTGALRALATLGDSGLTAALRSAMQDRDPDLRRTAVELAGRLQVRELLPGIRSALEDRDWNVPPAALEALGRLGDRESLPLLEKGALFGGRLAAIAAIGRLGARERTGDLADLLESEDESIVVTAAEALARMGARERIPDLHRVLVRAGSTTGESIALALARLGSRAGMRTIAEAAEEHAIPRQPYLWLNQLRATGIWNRFRSMVLEQPLEGTFEEGVGALAAVAGLRVEWTMRPPSEFMAAAAESRGRRAWCRLVPREGGEPLPDLLEKLLEESRFDVLFEGDRMRVLPRDLAAAAWAAWWEEERLR